RDVDVLRLDRVQPVGAPAIAQRIGSIVDPEGEEDLLRQRLVPEIVGTEEIQQGGLVAVGDAGPRAGVDHGASPPPPPVPPPPPPPSVPVGMDSGARQLRAAWAWACRRARRRAFACLSAVCALGSPALPARITAS